jgi:hypothetical protein
MKKFCFICLILAQMTYANSFLGDPYKGQVYYKYYIAIQTGVNGAIFTKQFTKQEWQKKFENGGKLFFEDLKLSKQGIDSEILTHLEAFCVYYAKDSDVVPSCGN